MGRFNIKYRGQSLVNSCLNFIFNMIILFLFNYSSKETHWSKNNSNKIDFFLLQKIDLTIQIAKSTDKDRVMGLISYPEPFV